MITPVLTEKAFWENQVEGYVFLMNENLETASTLANLSKIEESYYPHARKILKRHKFAGKKGQSFVLTAVRDEKLIQFFFIGIGKQNKAWHVDLEALRRGVGAAIQLLKKYGTKSAVMGLPDASAYSISREELLSQLVTVAHMANYEFANFKQKQKTPWELDLLIEVAPGSADSLQQHLEKGSIIGHTTNKARTWADMPANVLTPTALSKEAEKIALNNNLKCTIIERDQAKKLGMGSFLAVESGSDQDGKFVTLEYQVDKKAPTIALIGKGITFDTGGISLKPAGSMTGMKFDMSGAAAVIATMEIISKLKPNVNVVAVTPLTENMPSGKAARQDDIVTAMNGKSIEIKNTDAEGRLVLADALCYAEKFFTPDVMIDVATLTGACLYALGYFYTGLMTQDEKLLQVLPELGRKTGDKVWPLPFDDDFMPANKSHVADVANIGSPAYKAGTIIGACFLSNFVEKTPWAHLDIAGTADSVPGVNYLGNGNGSAGAAIRLLTEFVLSYKA